MRKVFWGALLAVIFSAGAATPILEDGHFTISLFAEQPEIWTPTGIAVDKEDRVFVIESNTHLPKTNYPGPKTDRIKIFEDRDGDGKPEKISIFAEGFHAAMNLAFGPKGDLYVVERAQVSVLSKTGAREVIARLETKGDFPHNGLGGIAVGEDGWVYLGFGENLGMSYTLTGSDGSQMKGGGEGGNIFRCRLDGKNLELFATGFWNPFSLAFDGAGNLFAVDNDPDGRPPCRLLHVIRGGNYGYQFKYGRSGLHPFVAWDGELPGTLPMVSGTGEAPSGLIWLSKLGWPAEYSRSFLGTSWGDNLLETFPLEPRGVSFKADRKIFARGDLAFRPVAMAAAKDGSIYITDWEDREYSVHQKGRIWKVAVKRAADPLVSDDPFIRSKAVNELAALDENAILQKAKSGDPKMRLAALLALRQKGSAADVKEFLRDQDEPIRRIAMIWAAERGLKELRPQLLKAVLAEPNSLALLQTYLAAEQIFEGYEKKSVWEQGSTGAELVEALLKDESKRKELRDLARKLKAAPQARPIVGAPVAEPATRPKTEREWLAAIGFGGQPDEGRKLFFSDRVGCAKCHRAQGEGGKVGPDLTVIARASDRAKLVNSILNPSANIGPLYVTHEIRTKDGKEFTGLVPEGKVSGKTVLIQTDGKAIEIAPEKIESDRVSDLSLMPAGLESGLTVREFADLISFLQTLK
jgi:putative membrane-bound dehydrogenase-like protein